MPLSRTSWRIWLAKRRHGLRVWRTLLGETLTDAALDPAQIYVALVAAIGAYYFIRLDIQRGLAGMSDIVGQSIGAFEAVCFAAGLFLVANLLAAIFRYPKAVASEGRWHDHEFIYNEPKLIFWRGVTSADNGSYSIFKVKDVEPGAHIVVRLEFEGFGSTSTKANVYPADIFENFKANFLKAGHFSEDGSRIMIALSRDRRLVMLPHSEVPQSTQIRVLLLSWKVP
jgi:hypothetical protein